VITGDAAVGAFRDALCDFWDATAQSVIASVLGFIDDEIEFVP
jgi:hypothetical protein